MAFEPDCKPLPTGWEDYAERFWKKVNRSSPDACWLWTGGIFSFGHGSFWIKPRTVRAHRVAWALTYHRDPAPLYVLHHCDTPPCCNPEHLFTGTKFDNSQDMVSKGRGGRPKGSISRTTPASATHCIRGHEFTPENTYVQPKSGNRQCRTCTRDYRREKTRAINREKTRAINAARRNS